MLYSRSAVQTPIIMPMNPNTIAYTAFFRISDKFMALIKTANNKSLSMGWKIINNGYTFMVRGWYI
jgi:hypothetical protein